MTGVVNLFAQTIRNPNNPSASSDVALIDAASGNFSRLEYASGGQLAISFSRELADYLRNFLAMQRDVSGSDHGLHPPCDQKQMQPNATSFLDFGEVSLRMLSCPTWVGVAHDTPTDVTRTTVHGFRHHEYAK